MCRSTTGNANRPNSPPRTLESVRCARPCSPRSGSSAVRPSPASIRHCSSASFPAATAFSPKGGDPPHVKALIADPKTGVQTPIGLAFWTTELEPLERGYDGPIKILIGIDMKGVLAGIVVAEHHEPYGNFSIDPPQFSAQFKGKDVRGSVSRGHRRGCRRHARRSPWAAPRARSGTARAGSRGSTWRRLMQSK